MRTLAEELKCDPTNVTFLADRLEQRHLVERQADSDDRRIRRLALTARGRSLRNRLVGAIKNDSPLSKLDNREQRELERLLERLLDDQA